MYRYVEKSDLERDLETESKKLQQLNMAHTAESEYFQIKILDLEAARQCISKKLEVCILFIFIQISFHCIILFQSLFFFYNLCVIVGRQQQTAIMITRQKLTNLKILLVT